MSLGGRTEHLFSDLILNEGDQTGYLGILDPKYVPNGKNNIYMDASRPKGMNIPGAVYDSSVPVSYTHLRAHETRHDLVCRLLLEKKKK